jgi:hypothetical protein
MIIGGRLVRDGMIAALLATTLTQALAAQVVRGTVNDATNHQPIAGAVVTLLDSSGAVLGRSLTNERGQYRVAYVRIARTIRVVRIGFLPREFRVGDSAEGDGSIDVVMTPFSTTLAPVQVTDKSNCPRRADRTTAFAFWEQARAGLLNTVVARETNPMSVNRLYFERRMDGISDRITRFTVTGDSASNSQTSFNAAHSARDFISSGFSTDTAGFPLMFGPDADVLLDDAFAQGYCFRIAESSKARPGQIGLAFAAADRRQGRVDIAGTLWIDTSARALQDIDFRYAGLNSATDKFRPGGTISFRSMTNGVVLIDRWFLRLFDTTRDTVYPGNCRPQCSRFRETSNRTEQGGELAHAVWPDGQKWNASLGSLRVHAVTSSGRPAAGAVVLLPETWYKATSDSAGTIAIDDLLPGPYTLRLLDARTATLGISLPTSVSFVAARDSTHRANLTVPTAEEYVAGLCMSNRQWTVNDSTYIFGRVVSPEGRPVADAKVTIALQKNDGQWSWSRDYYKTGTDGVFQSCSVSFIAGRNVRIRVAQEGLPNAEIVRVISGNFTTVKIPVPILP